MCRLLIKLNTSNWIAICALFITLPGYSYLAWGWWGGPKVKLFTPELIHFRCSELKPKVPKCTTKAETWLGATMSYINQGQKGYDEIVTQERVDFKFGDKSYIYLGHFFVNVVPGNKGWIKQGVSPFTVNGGGGGASHEVMFLAGPMVCEEDDCQENDSQLNWDRFLKEIHTTKQKLLELKFSFRSISKKKSTPAYCKVKIEDLKASLSKTPHRSFHQTPCWP